MIERICLRNFQCHEKFDLELDPCVTIIVGRTDVGKSSLLRLLRWVGFNKPSGKGFIKRGSSFCKGEVWVDGHRIVRKRGKENSYSLDGKKFVAFGQSGVPEEISNLLNIGEVNVQRQLDSPWWLLKSPGEVSRELNSIVSLDLIDKTLSNISHTQRESKTLLSLSQQRLTKAREDRDRLSWVVEANLDLKAIEDRSNNIDKIASGLRRISNLVVEGTKALLTYQNAVKTIGDAVEGMRRVDDKVGKIDKLAGSAERLESLIREAQEMEEQRCEVKRKEVKLQKKLEKALGRECPLCGRSQL